MYYHYSFGIDHKDPSRHYQSSTDPLMNVFKARYNASPKENMWAGCDWQFERRLDLGDFVLRLVDTIHDVDEDRCYFKGETLHASYDRKIGTIENELVQNIKILISDAQLQDALILEKRDDWVHLDTKYKFEQFERMKLTLWGIHLLIDGYMKEEKHLTKNNINGKNSSSTV